MKRRREPSGRWKPNDFAEDQAEEVQRLFQRRTDAEADRLLDILASLPGTQPIAKGATKDDPR